MRIPRMKTLAIVGAVAVAFASIAPVAASAPSLAQARASTAQFHRLAAADAAGYALPPAGVPLHECIASFDGTGAMGFHHINGALLDTTLDPTQPEALVYEPAPNGELRLVALEYVVFQEPWIAEHGTEMPMLFGQEFMPVGFPNRYEIPAFFALHVWIWKHNPSGLFAPFNPNVSC
jgi:hypothetical protein